MSENYIVVADIHGRYDLLIQLLEKLSLRSDLGPSYKYVFLGDMVDRGPQSYDVVELIKGLCDKRGAIALLGNHEDMMLRYFDGKIFSKTDIWLYNGGDKTVKSYGKAMKYFGHGKFFKALGLSGHAAWMKTLPYFYETDKVWFSHAPVSKVRGKMGQYRAEKTHLMWSYPSQVLPEGTNEHDHGKLAVCGHIHALYEGIVVPRVYPHLTYLDTGSGCAPHGRLTALIITDGKAGDWVQGIPDLSSEQERQERNFINQLQDKGEQYDI